VQFGDEDAKTTISYRFNVDYDESVFEPKTARFETNAWLKK
jgi:hypothetical protein